jgi:2-polyprenyl-6-methoxyphenol hydroxylase-like FAD-dependent oxidoreductase
VLATLNERQKGGAGKRGSSDRIWVIRLLGEVRASEDIGKDRHDTVSQIRMDRWSTGKVTLVGDAAYAPSFLSGQGTSLALVGRLCPPPMSRRACLDLGPPRGADVL